MIGTENLADVIRELQLLNAKGIISEPGIIVPESSTVLVKPHFNSTAQLCGVLPGKSFAIFPPRSSGSSSLSSVVLLSRAVFLHCRLCHKNCSFYTALQGNSSYNLYYITLHGFLRSFDDLLNSTVFDNGLCPTAVVDLRISLK